MAKDDAAANEKKLRAKREYLNYLRDALSDNRKQIPILIEQIERLEAELADALSV